MDERVLRTSGWCIESGTKERYWKAFTDRYSTSNHNGGDKSSIKFKAVDLSQWWYERSSHYTSTFSINQREEWFPTNWRSRGSICISRQQKQNIAKFKPTTWFCTMINRIMKKGNRYLVDEFGSSGKTLPPTSVRKEANHEQAWIQSSKEPKLEDIVKIKDFTPRCIWRIGKIPKQSRRSEINEQ